MAKRSPPPATKKSTEMKLYAYLAHKISSIEEEERQIVPVAPSVKAALRLINSRSNRMKIDTWSSTLI